MVTGDVIPTAGTAELEGLNILTQQREVKFVNNHIFGNINLNLHIYR